MKSAHFSIVLVEPRGDANIGAAARAMKNFGVTDLRLVNPVRHLTKAAYMWAVEAADVLESAKVFDSLDNAIADKTFSAAFTRRLGKLRKKRGDVWDLTPGLIKRAKLGSVALVFGREDKGLSNDELGLCDAVINIPTHSSLPSINLAQSVLLACYEIFKFQIPAGHTKKNRPDNKFAEEFVPRSSVAEIMKKIDTALAALEYEALLAGKISKRLAAIFGRAGLLPRDLGMLDGLVSKIIETSIHS